MGSLNKVQADDSTDEQQGCKEDAQENNKVCDAGIGYVAYGPFSSFSGLGLVIS
jgi:hypothetical protein